jgi:hypothetical protein
MPKDIAPELVTETVRFCAQALRQKAAEVEQAAQDAESPSAALAAIGSCLCADSLMVLGQDPLARLAEGLALYPGSSAEALEAFGEEADPLRAMLDGHEAAAAE